MDPVSVGEKIAALRKTCGMTQVELAQKVCVTNRAVSKWENGYNFPELALMAPLAKALGVTVVELLDLEDKSVGEVFGAVSDISEEKQKRLQNRIRTDLCAILIFSAILAVNLMICILGRISFSAAWMLYPIAVIGFSIELLVHLRRLHRR